MKLSEKKLQELKDKKISIEELNDKYFYTEKDGINVGNILKLLNENICSFQQIADKFKSTKDSDNNPCLRRLLWNEKLFEELIQSSLLSKEDLKYLLNRINKELNVLCWNIPLIKYILNEFVLNKELVDRFNTIIENDAYWCKNRNMHTLFDQIEYENEDNEEILKLNELNKKVCSFDLNEEQRDELVELIQNNEIALNRLISVVDNNLESNYDFDSLMSYLKKEEKKNILNI